MVNLKHLASISTRLLRKAERSQPILSGDHKSDLHKLTPSGDLLFNYLHELPLAEND